MFSLSIVHKGGQPRIEKYNQAEVSIGRVPGNDLVLPGANISKRHARIVFNYAKNSFVVVDNKSTNGTIINGERIEGPYDLQEGDKIYVGDFVIQVKPGARGEKPANSPRPRKLVPLKGEKTQQAPPEQVAEVIARQKAKKPGGDLDDFGADWDEPAASAGDDWDDFEEPSPGQKGSDAWEDEEDWEEPAKQKKATTSAVEEEGWEDQWDDGNASAGGDDDWGSEPGTEPAPNRETAAPQDDWDELDELESDLPGRPRAERASGRQKKPRESGGKANAPPPNDDDLLAELEDDPPESQPQVNVVGATDAEVIACLKRYIEIDEAYRLQSFGKPCACGKCLLCQAREAVEMTGDDASPRGRPRPSARRRG